MNVSNSSTFNSSPLFGRAYSAGCQLWTSAASNSSGVIVTPDGGFNASSLCNVARPLACCNGPTKAEFAGFTSANAITTTGRLGMHAACSAELPGSHLCHAAEYMRAASAVPVPATGAWIDSSIDPTSSSTTFNALPGSGRAYSAGCQNWTSSSSNSSGVIITPDGAFNASALCNVGRPAACCF